VFRRAVAGSHDLDLGDKLRLLTIERAVVSRLHVQPRAAREVRRDFDLRRARLVGCNVLWRLRVAAVSSRVISFVMAGTSVFGTSITA